MRVRLPSVCILLGFVGFASAATPFTGGEEQRSEVESRLCDVSQPAETWDQCYLFQRAGTGFMKMFMNKGAPQRGVLQDGASSLSVAGVFSNWNIATNTGQFLGRLLFTKNGRDFEYQGRMVNFRATGYGRLRADEVVSEGIFDSAKSEPILKVPAPLPPDEEKAISSAIAQGLEAASEVDRLLATTVNLANDASVVPNGTPDAGPLEIKGIRLGMSPAEVANLPALKGWGAAESFTIAGVRGNDGWIHPNNSSVFQFRNGRLVAFYWEFPSRDFQKVVAAMKEKYPQTICQDSFTMVYNMRAATMVCRYRELIVHSWITRVDTAVLQLFSKEMESELQRGAEKDKRDF